MNGNQLDAIRKSLGLTKDELARAIGISRPTLDTRLADPSTFTLCEAEKACKALKIDKSHLLNN